MNLTHTISWLEVGRMIIGLVGLVLVSANLLDNITDLVIMWKSGQNGIKEYACKTTLWFSGSIFAGQLSLLGYIIIAMTQPSRNTTASSIASTIISVFFSLLFTYIGFIANHRKHELIEMIKLKFLEDEGLQSSPKRP